MAIRICQQPTYMTSRRGAVMSTFSSTTCSAMDIAEWSVATSAVWSRTTFCTAIQVSWTSSCSSIPCRPSFSTTSPRRVSTSHRSAPSATGRRDYRYLQGATPDELAAELDTPAKRRRYIAGMYGHRMWASPGTFSAADVDFMTEPFSTEERMRAGWAAYQLAHGRPVSEPPILDRLVDVPTLILYGMDDHVVGPDFLTTCEVAFTDRTGPVVLPGAGHFLQWERADLFNPLVIAYFGDVRVRHPR